jgi:uncharacterized protein YcbK (DUF882 family)
LTLPRSRRAARRVGLAALLLLFATEGLQNAVADGETRTLTFHHTHTGEDLTVTFRRNGRYDDAALARLNHFLRDWRNNDEIKMDPRLFDVVWDVYHEVGGKAPIQIISAYRSPVTNAMLRHRSRHTGVAQYSQHMLGKAMDMNIPGVPLEDIRIAGLRLQRGGVGFYPTSGSPFVHLDVGNIRHWPRMTHDQLVRVFPDGRTVHIPSDGRPLKNYALALADVERRGSNPSYMSLAAARGAGIVTAQAEQALNKPKRSILARLFGFGREDEDEDDSSVGAISRPSEAASRPVQVAAAIPMPRPRPRAARPGPMLLASAVPLSAQFTSTAPTPSQVVAARGVWGGADAFQPPEAERPAVKGDRAEARLVWRTGPQPAAARLVAAAAKLASSSRLRASALHDDGPETTASPPHWPGEPPAEDVSPSEMVLAYAAPGPAPTTARANPMGSLRPVATVVHKVPPGHVARAPAPAHHLLGNPWLRGMIATPSVRTALAVTVVGRPDYRALAHMMLKPRASIANAFADDPQFGLTTISFSGPAVGILPIVGFGTLTAQLR